VVIPALDERELLPGAIASARNAGADEVIVVDGGSRDGTAGAARGRADRVLVTSAGRALQMNAGARAASGEILLFLHADSRLPAGAGAAVRDAVAAGAGGGAFAVRLLLSPGASPWARALLAVTAPMIGLRARLFRSYTGDQGIFVTRSLFDEIGGYPAVPLMEDVLLSRAMRRRARTVLLPGPVETSARRWEAAGPLRTILLMWAVRLAHLAGAAPARCAALYARSRGRREEGPRRPPTPT